METILKLTHPFAPFVTETIWQTLAWQPDSLLMTSRWPIVPAANSEQAKSFEEVKSIITEVRFLVSSLKLKETKLHYIAPQSIKDNAGLIERLTRIKTVTEVQLGPGLRLINTPYECWLDVDNKLLKQYIIELTQKQKAQQDVVLRLINRLHNTNYLTKAPAGIIEATKQELTEAQAVLDTITKEHQRFAPKEMVKPDQIQPPQPPVDPPKPA